MSEEPESTGLLNRWMMREGTQPMLCNACGKAITGQRPGVYWRGTFLHRSCEGGRTNDDQTSAGALSLLP